MFMMWLGEQITERGIGNGISMLIFAGIVAGIPGALGQSFESARQGDINIIALLAVGLLAVAIIGFVVFIERGSVASRCITPSVSRGVRSSQRRPAICR